MAPRIEIDQEKLAASIARQLGAWFERKVEAAADLARAEAPRGATNRLADNIVVRYETDGLVFRARIVANVEYAAAVHNGARAHPIDPVNRRFLRFQTAGGTIVFARHVDHPGNAPQPFLADSVRRSLGGG